MANPVVMGANAGCGWGSHGGIRAAISQACGTVGAPAGRRAGARIAPGSVATVNKRNGGATQRSGVAGLHYEGFCGVYMDVPARLQGGGSD